MSAASSFPSWLGRTTVTGLAYFVAGKLALLMAIPPGYATSIWPAAGIALVLTLLWGYRVWPGVLLGSFFVNVGVSFDAGSTAAIARSVAIASGIGAGAALQAVFGAFLVRRFVGSPGSLEENREILLFVGLGALLGCTVSTSVAMCTLVAADLVIPGNYGFTWVTWWIGDAIGVMVFAPVLLSFMGEPRSAWRRRRYTVALPLLVGFALVALLFVRSGAWERERIDADFARRAAVMVHQLRRQLDQYVEAIESLAGLFRTTPGLTRDEFRTFTRAPVQRHLEMLALLWTPLVPSTERHVYEELARRDGFPEFEVTAQSLEGTFVRAPPREEYFPVYYLEPLTGDEAALGFDLGSDRPRREVLEWARDTGLTTATPPFHPALDTRRQLGVLLLAPVYRSPGGPPTTVEERRATLQGFAMGVLRVGPAIDAAFQGLDHAGMNVRLVDESAPAADAVLHATESGLGDAEMTSPVFSIAFDVAGRRWRFSAWPTPTYLAAHRSFQAWIVLSGGFFFVGLLGTLLLNISGAEARAEAQFRDLYSDAPDMYCSLSAGDGSVLDCNDTMAADLGYAREDIVGRSVLDFCHPDSVDAGRASLHSFATTGVVRDTELQLRRSDGAKLDVSLSVAPVRDARGRLVRGRAMWRDVSVRKRAERDQQLLLQLGEDLRLTADFAGLLHRVATAVGEHLDLSRCHFSEADLTNGNMIIHRDYYSGVPSVAGTYPLSMFSSATIAGMKAGRTAVNVDTRTDAQTSRHFETAYQPYGLGAYVAVPLLRDGRWRGTLWASVERPRAWTDREIALLQTVAERTWLRMEHVRMVQALRESEERYRDLSQSLERRVEERTSQLTLAGAQVRTALREKEVLLKEVYHRVKNNLQVVSSLLDLQSRHLGGKSSQAVLQDSSNRVKTMAMVHERLYRSGDLSRLDFADYLRQLAGEIFRSHATSAGRGVSLDVDVCEMFIEPETLIPCGLIVNELVSNALKHGFPDGRRGEVRIRVAREGPGQIRLVVSDDGIGLPETVNGEKASALGLQLVDMLSRQLGGKLSIERDAGTTVSIIFPAPPTVGGHA